MPSSTGATHGRAGGVAGAGSRAARALAAAPRVVPVGTLRTPLGPLNGHQLNPNGVCVRRLLLDPRASCPTRRLRVGQLSFRKICA